MKRGNNILTTFLNALKVKYTKSFSNKFYNEHPYKYNLFGLSKMLDFYGVSNAGFRIKEKHTAIFELPTPFIAQIDGDFALVDTVSAANVSYRLGNHSLILALDEFCEKWTGVVLLAERHANSIEPDYLFHKKSEVINSSLRYGFIVLVITTLLIGFFHNNSMQLGSLILLIANSLGVFIGYLLVEQQINTSGSYSDKICSLFRESDCNDILESKASKLFGIVSWGEIGLAYFVSNLIVLCFFPELIEYSGIMSGLSLGYVCWSVWYQKFRARQWCVLCLASLLVLLLLFFVNLSLGYISLRGVTIDDLLLIILIYLIPILACVNLLPHIRGKNKTENVMQEINSLKVHQG